MLKPQLPNIPGAGAVGDTLDFVKNLWGSMSVPGVNLPGMAAPTLSVDELDKKIADLKAVEAWLNVNLSMLRGTVQALEIQRGTIATLKSMGATLANAVKQPGANEKTVLAAAPYASAFFSQPAVEPMAKVEPVAAPKAEPAPPAADKQAPAKDTAAANPMANPTVWWNMLQDQFKQAVSTALSSDAMASAQDAANKLADSNPALKLGKAMVSAAVKAPAKKAAKVVAEAPAKVKPAAKKAAAKRAPAKPRAGKAG